MAITIGKSMASISHNGMNKLIVDCGATKADWVLGDGKTSIRTPGFNLAQTPREQLHRILDEVSFRLGSDIGEIHFYAAGLVGNPPVDLGQWFPGASIEYASDMLGTARAVCGREPGIAAIIGTGANTCQYDGASISRKVNCGGFILGDEGSAAVLGKLFLTDYLKGFVPKELADEFAAQFPADYPSIVKEVYGSVAPARFLGSLAPFLHAHYATCEYVKNLIDNNFRAFFERTVRQYDQLPLGITGGFGYACRDTLRALGQEYGICISTISASPLEGLLRYHGL